VQQTWEIAEEKLGATMATLRTWSKQKFGKVTSEIKKRRRGKLDRLT
jgi:hypothetical protein